MQILPVMRIASIGIMIFLACGCGVKQHHAEPEVIARGGDTITEIRRSFVFGDDRPFKQGHASTILRTTDHRYLIAWFGGTHESHDDVGIWLSKGEPGDWSAPIEVAKVRENAHWN